MPDALLIDKVHSWYLAAVWYLAEEAYRGLLKAAYSGDFEVATIQSPYNQCSIYNILFGLAQS